MNWFDNERGFGFIQKDSGGKDLFVHFSAVVGDGYKSLKQDDRVEFEVVSGKKGPQAANVVKVAEKVCA